MIRAKDLRVPFWLKQTGNLMSHGTGLTQEQVDALHQLRVGDRLILWDERNTENRDERSMTHQLRLYTK